MSTLFWNENHILYIIKEESTKFKIVISYSIIVDVEERKKCEREQSCQTLS